MRWDKKWDGVLIMLLASVVFTLGINWGLPSRASDPYLFGDRTPWTGQQIMQLIGDQHSARGADVDANPITDRSEPVLLNGTDAQRAEIVRRYRLYSHQPDEMNTFMALAQMHPGQLDLDPKMYKYGGLWVYPVGAIIKAGGMLGLIDVRSDITFYLDHPEEFGKFYIAARLYSAAWGVLGAYVVWRLCRRLLNGIGLRTDRMKDPDRVYRWLAVFGAMMFILMPITVNMAHEAKPHLAGAVLGLIACGYAMRYIAEPKWKHAILAGVFCGLSMGMVLTGALSFILLPAMFVLSSRRKESKPAEDSILAEESIGLRQLEKEAGIERTDDQSDVEHLLQYLQQNIEIPYRPWTARLGHMLTGLLLAGLIYCITNPYVPLNFVRDRTLLLGNLQNSADFYQAGSSGIQFVQTVTILFFGTGIFVGGLGWGGMIFAIKILLIRWRTRQLIPGPTMSRQLRLTFLLTIMTLSGLVPLYLFAGRQGYEYARFGALPMALLPILSLFFLASTNDWRMHRIMPVIVVLFLGIIVSNYEQSFLADRPTSNTRIEAAEEFSQLDVATVGVWVEPAPFSMPPVDIFEREIYLMPRNWAPMDSVDKADLLVVLPEKLLPQDWYLVGWKHAIYLRPLSWANRIVQWTTPEAHELSGR